MAIEGLEHKADRERGDPRIILKMLECTVVYGKADHIVSDQLAG